mmetsp:Transcript_24048/g.33676  ORF Transcript_24048/g.33676 Transcript_24048/m.33676 type:complete len:135 (+) Transcript_24048:939-1343(+)
MTSSFLVDSSWRFALLDLKALLLHHSMVRRTAQRVSRYTVLNSSCEVIYEISSPMMQFADEPQIQGYSSRGSLEISEVYMEGKQRVRKIRAGPRSHVRKSSFSIKDPPPSLKFSCYLLLPRACAQPCLFARLLS